MHLWDYCSHYPPLKVSLESLCLLGMLLGYQLGLLETGPQCLPGRQLLVEEESGSSGSAICSWS